MESVSDASRDILRRIIHGEIKDPEDLARAKIDVCRRFGLSRPLKNSEILSAANTGERKRLLEILRLKPVRSISGVSVITVMPEPHPCPKPDRCIYCPGGPNRGTPPSYTGKEPAAARAVQNRFDPFSQVRSRVEQLRAIGHDVDKVELVVFGGTLTAYPPEYLRRFMLGCLNAITGVESENLDEAMVRAENSEIHISDITFETRPDWCYEQHVDMLLGLGATRVELGVQTLFDDVYDRVKRGHSVDDVVRAFMVARDSGLAVVAHMMPNLPGSNPERDLEMFRALFEDERFRPDALKIYPTLVMPSTELYEMWKRGEHRPYELQQLIELIVEIKRLVPPWVRIQRIQRDIPADLIADGVRKGDIRSMVQARLKERGERCRCVRCREVGHVWYRENLAPRPEKIELVRRQYDASGGKEVFLSFEDTEQDILIGLLRLRIPSVNAHRPEISSRRTAVVRELHIYGQMVRVSEEAGNNAWQHQGFGERLLAEAERISRDEFDAERVAVLAGLGTRNYYRRFGYELEGPYMVKEAV